MEWMLETEKHNSCRIRGIVEGRTLKVGRGFQEEKDLKNFRERLCYA